MPYSLFNSVRLVVYSLIRLAKLWGPPPVVAQDILPQVQIGNRTICHVIVWLYPPKYIKAGRDIFEVLHCAWYNLNLKHNLAISITFNANIRASDVSHKMKIIWLKAFTEPLVNERHRDCKL